MNKHEVESPLPGTFYRRPSPDANPFKEVGERVATGDVIGLIEVMKQFTEVTADVAGAMVQFLVDDGDAVEPGQILAVIEKS